MIYLVIGTKAQLIKMAPIMCHLRDRQIPYRYISTGQHRDTVDEILRNFALRPADMTLYNGVDITGIAQMGKWALRILWQLIKNKRSIFPEKAQGEAGIVLVHGDTFSTLLGAVMGRVAGLQVGHVESGLRSFNLWHPFPEELTRLLTFRLSHVYFCPNAWTVDNLAGYRGEKVLTHGNTLLDALNQARRLPAPAELAIPTHRFAVVTLHRFENVFSATALARLVACVERIAAHTPLLFILHKPTEIKLRQFAFFERLQANPHIELRPRYDYFSFVKLLEAADFVVSDGGSNQEECAYLGKPILLLREATERTEGLGANCVLSRYQDALIDEFLHNLAQHRQTLPTPEISPAACIANYCAPYSQPPV